MKQFCSMSFPRFSQQSGRLEIKAGGIIECRRPVNKKIDAILFIPLVIIAFRKGKSCAFKAVEANVTIDVWGQDFAEKGQARF